jgi:hypothetical protein
MSKFIFYKSVQVLIVCVLFSQQNLYAYSVLTHEAIIDATWDKSIQPLLLEKYPGSTPDQLKDAHAYAYGGCIAPDMGYYPFGSKLFTDLVHYVRTGDFVNALIDEAQNLNEYAFAIGVLCHYNADKYGHPIATNRCVPIVYPKDKEKFGTVVTYEQDPVTHVRMEFGFDVLQTARVTYASEKYHEFIGFKVSAPVLERAFLKTYGINISDIFTDFPLATETFRWVVKNFFPVITRAAWAAKKKEIQQSNPTITRRKFEYKMHNANYYHEYGKKHDKPGFFPGALAVVVRFLPKVGPLRSLKLHIPGPDAEKLFIQSFDTVTVHFTASLKKLPASNHRLANIDFDTGNDTYSGEYNLADDTYCKLVLKLKELDFKNVNDPVRQNIIKFYGSCNEKMAAMEGADQWNEITAALEQLKQMKPNQ